MRLEIHRAKVEETLLKKTHSASATLFREILYGYWLLVLMLVSIAIKSLLFTILLPGSAR